MKPGRGSFKVENCEPGPVYDVIVHGDGWAKYAGHPGFTNEDWPGVTFFTNSDKEQS